MQVSLASLLPCAGAHKTSAAWRNSEELYQRTMFRRTDSLPRPSRRFLALLAAWLGGSLVASALPTITSYSPPMGATGVSRTEPVIVTFSEPMLPLDTTVLFVDSMAGPVPANTTWNANNTRMTNTPATPFAAGRLIYWGVDGYGASGPLSGAAEGYFTTATGGTGDCTNTMGSITLAKGAFYEQTSPAAPVLNTNAPYAFVACSAVACSNWTTTGISLALPFGLGATNIPAETIPGHYNLTACFSNATDLESTFPDGDYMFNLPSPPTVTSLPMTLPGTIAFPSPAPHLTNYGAAQAIDAAQPFVLGWDQAPGSVDCIYVEIYGAFATPALGQAAALNGAARSVTVPAHTLAQDRTYTGAITFYDLVLATNQYVTLAYRATTTEFSLATAGASTSITFTNCTVSGGVFAFEVTSAAGQAMAIETCTDPASGPWTTLLATNSPGGRIRVNDPMLPGNTCRFYRVKKLTP
jgi:Bacterial Ig-like domain